MTINYDFKKDWPRLKKELFRVSQEAKELVKKGEEQIVKLTQKGKLHLDETALQFKKDHLLGQIGREYVAMKCPGTKSVKMEKFIKELVELEKKIKAVKRDLRQEKRKTAKAA